MSDQLPPFGGRGRRVRGVWVSVMLLAMWLPTHGRGAGAGTAGANLLKVSVGSRGLAMAGAATALPGDLSGLLANPALLSQLGSRALMLMRWPGVADMRTDFLSYSVPLGRLGLWAGTVLFRTLPAIDNVSDWTRRAPVPAPVPGEAPVPVNDGMLMISTGRTIGKSGGHAGVNIKLFNSSLGDVRASSVAMDVGALMKARGPKSVWWPSQYGVSVVNLGYPIRHESVGEALPLGVRGGVSWYRLMYPHSFTLASDLVVNIEQDVRLAAGAEWVQGGRLGLRTGASIGRYRKANFSLGAGWQLRSTLLGPEAEYHFDYAYLPFAFLAGFAPTHAFSVFVKF